jgi:hypothetical protein
MEKAVPHVVIPTNKSGDLVFQNESETQDKKLEFTTAIAKAVHHHLFTKPRSKPTDIYLYGRTSFVFNFDNGDIPTTLIKSKEELPKLKVQEVSRSR